MSTLAAVPPNVLPRRRPELAAGDEDCAFDQQSEGELSPVVLRPLGQGDGRFHIVKLDGSR